MANEAVMVTDGDTKVLFDPLYPESYGQYLLVPEAMREALFAGEEPLMASTRFSSVTSTETISLLKTCSDSDRAARHHPLRTSAVSPAMRP